MDTPAYTQRHPTYTEAPPHLSTPQVLAAAATAAAAGTPWGRGSNIT